MRSDALHWRELVTTPYVPPPPTPGNPYARAQPRAGSSAPPGPGVFNPYAPPSATADRAWSEGHAHVDMLAERGARLGARILDGVLVFAAVFVAAIPLAALADSDTAGGVLVTVFMMVMIVQWTLLATTGQTLAKRWLGIRVVKLDGSPAGFVHAVFLRSWVTWLLIGVTAPIVVGELLAIIDPLLIFGDERRCLHDYLAGTKVIHAPRG